MARENIFKLGFTVALVATLVSLLISKFLSGILGLQQLYSTIPLKSGISPTIYNSIAGIFQGFGFDLTSFLILVVSSIILVAAGLWLVDLFNIKTRGDFERYFAAIMLGTGLGYVIFIGFVVPNIMTIVGALLYAAIVSLLTATIYPWVDRTIKG